MLSFCGVVLGQGAWYHWSNPVSGGGLHFFSAVELKWPFPDGRGVAAVHVGGVYS